MAADRARDDDEDGPGQESFFSRFKFLIILLIVLLGMALSQDGVKDSLHQGLLKAEKYVPFLGRIGSMFHEPASKSKQPKKSASKTKEKKGEISDFDSVLSSALEKQSKLFTDADLKAEGKLYLSLLGFVIDVTEGEKYYGADSGYSGFIGRDGSRAFITGEFNEGGLTSDLEGLESKDYIGLFNWLKFYLDHEKYKHIGFHIGRYFDSKGKPTAEISKFRGWLEKGEEEKKSEEDVNKEFPPCNVEWNKEDGTTFWCSQQSGGIQRNWKGKPREFFQLNGKKRCACLHPDKLSDPRFKVYEGCDPNAERCKGPK